MQCWIFPNKYVFFFTCTCAGAYQKCATLQNACSINMCTTPGVLHGSYDASGWVDVENNGALTDLGLRVHPISEEITKLISRVIANVLDQNVVR